MYATRLKSSLPFLVLLAIALAGVGAWIYQLQQGLIATNMRNGFSWGLYVAMWAFFVGTAAGGLVVTSAIYLLKMEKLKPVGRIAPLTAFVFTLAAMSMLIPDMGRPDRIYNLIIHPQFQSVLVWDFIVLSTYALIAAIYLYNQLRPGIARNGIQLPGIGTVGKQDLSDQEYDRLVESAERRARMIAPVALIFAILIHTVTAWVLATQLSRSWWFGGALAPTFIAAAVACGPAVVILASLFLLKRTDEVKQACGILAKIAAFSSAILLFIYYNDFVVRAWWGQGAEFEASKLVLTRYLPLHLVEVVLIVGAVYLFLRYAKSVRGLVLGSLAVNIGVLFHRFLLIPSAYNLVPFRIPVANEGGLVEWAFPIAVGEVRGTLDSTTRVFTSNWEYVPSPVEFMITAGIFSAVALAIISLSKVLPTTVAKT